jgi:hypothetical protein
VFVESGEISMAFVCEEMSDSDFHKYEMEFYGRRFGGWGSRIWMRDAEGDMYFKFASRDLGGESRNATYLFYWEGNLYKVVLFQSYQDDEKGPRVEISLQSIARVEKEGEKLRFFRDVEPSDRMLDCLKMASTADKASESALINKPPTKLVFNF